MKLRNFLYINTKILEDYISAIDGYIYDEQTLSDTTTSKHGSDAKVNIKVASVGGDFAKEESSETIRSVKISDAAKFDRLFNYLNEDDLKYYEVLNQEIFLELHRDDFIEVLVTPRFSKIKEMSNTINQLSKLVNAFQDLTDQELLDNKAKQAIQGFKTLDSLNSTESVSCVFNFEDRQFPLIAQLDNQYFKCEQERFVGEVYMLCKIQKKIEKGKSIKLDEIFESFKNLPLNREQKRKMPKNIENPAEFKDIIKGPAITIVPVAIYQ